MPIAGGIAALNLFVERDLAERITVVVWPCILLAALLFGVLLLARRLFAPPILIAAAVIVALNPLLQFQLAPGGLVLQPHQRLIGARQRGLVNGIRRRAFAGKGEIKRLQKRGFF